MQERTVGGRWRWLRSPGTMLVLMLALGALVPRGGRFAWLRGERDLNAEIATINAAGYYEELLNAGRGRSVDQKRTTRPNDWVPFVESGLITFDPGYRRWRIRPGLAEVWNGCRFTTNSQGHRSPEIELPKPAGTYRVVVLGSSNTMGHGVNEGAIYVRLLENWLNEQTGPEGRHVEVVNLASSGESPSQRLLRLREDVERLEPDWVLCDASVIDVSLEELHLDQMVRGRVEIPFDYVRNALRRARVSPKETSARCVERIRTVALELLEGAYGGFGEEKRRLGTALTVVLLPRADRLAQNPTLRGLIKSHSRRNGLEIYDLFDAFEGSTIEEVRVAPWDNHPNELGHQKIFEALRQAIQEQGGCPGLDLSGEDRDKI